MLSASLTVSLLSFLLSTPASAFPSLVPRQDLDSQQDPYPFLGVPEDGIRSPCPAHNTLANHGFSMFLSRRLSFTFRAPSLTR